MIPTRVLNVNSWVIRACQDKLDGMIDHALTTEIHSRLSFADDSDFPLGFLSLSHVISGSKHSLYPNWDAVVNLKVILPDD
jgi:hypothetical protein